MADFKRAEELSDTLATREVSIQLTEICLINRFDHMTIPVFIVLLHSE